MSIARGIFQRTVITKGLHLAHCNKKGHAYISLLQRRRLLSSYLPSILLTASAILSTEYGKNLRYAAQKRFLGGLPSLVSTLSR